MPLPPEVVQDHVEYEVEEILDKKVRRCGQGYCVKYLAKLKGYPLSDTSWEPIANLDNAAAAIADFERQHPEAAPVPAPTPGRP